MENNKTPEEEIVDTVRNEFRSLKDDMNGRFEKFDARFDSMDTRFEKVDARFDSLDARFEKVDARLDSTAARLDGVDFQLGGINVRFDGVHGRLDKVDKEIGKLGVLMEVLDDKFTLMSEGQDILREILETRVARIEENLGIGRRA